MNEKIELEEHITEEKEQENGDLKSKENATGTETIENLENKNKKTTLRDKIKVAFSPEKRKKTIILLIICVAIIGIAIGIVSYLSPESVAKRFAKAVTFGDEATLCSLYGYDYKARLIDINDCEDEEEFFEEMSLYYDEDIESWNDYFKAEKKSRKERLEDQFGKFSYSSEVTKSKPISKNKLISELGESFIERFADNYGLNEDAITKGQQVTVKLKIKGEDDTERLTVYMDLAKINGFWKVMKFDLDL